MPMTNLNVRIDEDLKRETEKILAALGLNMTTAINAFARAVVRERRIPFELSLRVPNSETRQALDDAINGRNLNGPFKNAKELLESLDA